MKKTNKTRETEAWSIIRNTVRHIEEGNDLAGEAPLTASTVAGILEWKRGLEEGKPLPLADALESVLTRLTHIGRELEWLGEEQARADTTLVDAALDLGRELPEPLAWMGRAEDQGAAATAFAASLLGRDFDKECGRHWSGMETDSLDAFRIAGAYLASIDRGYTGFLLTLAAVALERARKGGEVEPSHD